MVELILSSVFYKPDEGLIKFLLDVGLDELKDRLSKLGHSRKANSLEKIRENISKVDYLSTLKLEYNNLFFGPGKLLAPPYSSIYIDGLGQIETKTTKKVEEIYRNWGVKIVDSIKEPVDHIAIELSFINHLDNIYNETGNLEALEQKKEFLGHMNSWIGKLAEQIKDHEALGFYGTMGEILTLYIESQLNKMKK